MYPRMTVYKNLSGDPTISSYEISQNQMIIEYTNGSAFLYNQTFSGTLNLFIMKDLAQTGKGLETYIQRFVDEKKFTL